MQMESRTIIRGLLFATAVGALVGVSGSARSRAQEGCPPGQVCNPFPCGENFESTDCTTEFATFTPAMDTWTYIFDANNAIKISTDVLCTAFPLQVDRIRISQAECAARRDSQFADTVCNPSFDGVDCVFYRVHGETVPRSCYAQVDYKVFWNVPTIQGNKHDWMLLRAPCEEFEGDSNFCDAQPFSEDITTMVDRKPPVGTDPVVGGNADGMSDYIVAISTKHPHKGIPSSPF
ncbi:MAG TPA: hypothetical protein VIW45_03660 [Vicinamibacterales bacterium]|jgi:hypothetical protein